MPVVEGEDALQLGQHAPAGLEDAGLGAPQQAEGCDAGVGRGRESGRTPDVPVRAMARTGPCVGQEGTAEIGEGRSGAGAVREPDVLEHDASGLGDSVAAPVPPGEGDGAQGDDGRGTTSSQRHRDAGTEESRHEEPTVPSLPVESW
jgi:hypothetical protein